MELLSPGIISFITAEADCDEASATLKRSPPASARSGAAAHQRRGGDERRTKEELNLVRNVVRVEGEALLALLWVLVVVSGRSSSFDLCCPLFPTQLLGSQWLQAIRSRPD